MMMFSTQPNFTIIPPEDLQILHLLKPRIYDYYDKCFQQLKESNFLCCILFLNDILTIIMLKSYLNYLSSCPYKLEQ